QLNFINAIPNASRAQIPITLFSPSFTNFTNASPELTPIRASNIKLGRHCRLRMHPQALQRAPTGAGWRKGAEMGRIHSSAVAGRWVSLAPLNQRWLHVQPRPST